MTTFERRQRILALLEKQPGIRVPEMAALLGVSEGTIRNDLNALEGEGRVSRVHGGARLVEDGLKFFSPSFAGQARSNESAKRKMARWAAELVEDGDSIFVDASSTVYYLAAQLLDRSGLRVVTNGIEVARYLAQNPTHTVMLLGGVVNQHGSSVSGAFSERLLNELRVKLAFVSCSGFTPQAGLTEVHLPHAQLKTRAIASAGSVVALVDSSKFGKVDLTAFASLDQVSHLFTDDLLPAAWLEQLKHSGLNFTVCGEDSASDFTPSNPQTRHYRIGFANLTEKQPFAQDVRRGLERAAKEAGNIDLVLGDNQLDPQVALQVAERFLSQNLDLVIEYQIDQQVGSRIMSRFKEAGIPVIAVDIPMIGATYFGVDNYTAGYMAGVAAGRWVQAHWDGCLDRLVILEEPRAGELPASRIQGQLDGMQSVLGALPAGQQQRLDSANTEEVSQAHMAEALKQAPAGSRLVALCFNDEAAMGVLNAARRLKREADVIIVGMGADRRVREELKRGGSRILGSTAFNPEAYGEKLIPLALSILRGLPVPPAVFMEHTFITRETEMVQREKDE